MYDHPRLDPSRWRGRSLTGYIVLRLVCSLSNSCVLVNDRIVTTTGVPTGCGADPTEERRIVNESGRNRQMAARRTSRRNRRTAGAWLVAALVVIVTGCAPEHLLDITIQDDLIFLTQNRRPSAAMEALFTGPVVADDAGCLRLASEEGPTVVWPEGYTLDTSGDVPRVLDEDGAPAGAFNEELVLAGGEVPTLRTSMGFTDEDRERAEACPGRYWLVNDAD